MTWQDIVTGGFETFGGIPILMSILKTHRDKRVTGLHVSSNLFFTTWGLWNLYYWPHLGQVAAFLGGVVLCLANVVWLGQVLYYQGYLKPYLARSP